MWAPSNRGKAPPQNQAKPERKTPFKEQHEKARKEGHIAPASSSAGGTSGRAASNRGRGRAFQPKPQGSQSQPSSPPQASAAQFVNPAQTLGEEASRLRAYAALNNPAPATPNANFSPARRDGGRSGSIVTGRSSGGRKRDRKAEQAELIKSIWGESSDEEDTKDDSATEEKKEAEELVQEDEGVVVEKPKGKEQEKQKLGVEDSIWAPKNRNTPEAPVTSASVEDKDTPETTKEPEQLAEKVDNLSLQPVNPPRTPSPVQQASVKLKTPEPIPRMSEPTGAASGGMNWAEEDEEDMGEFMQDVMAQWGVSVPAFAKPDVVDKLEPVKEEKKEEEKAEKKALADRIEWERPGSRTAPSSPTKTTAPLPPRRVLDQVGMRGRGGSVSARGHARKQSHDFPPQNNNQHHHHQYQQQQNQRRPTELIDTPQTPDTANSTAIVTPSDASSRKHDDQIPESKQQTGPQRPGGRPRLALQDSNFQRMAKGLLRDAPPRNQNKGKEQAKQEPAPAAAEAPVDTNTDIADADGWNEVKPKARSMRGRKRQ
jgi:hypothetical protein